MDFSKLAAYLQKLESLSARLEITAVLAEMLKESKQDEVDKVAYLCLGRLAPFYAGIELNLAERMVCRALVLAYSVEESVVDSSYQKLGDFGEVAYKLSSKKKSCDSGLSISEVYSHLYTIATTGGVGSQEKKLSLLSSLLKKSDPTSAKYIIRIILKKLRLGFSDKTLMEALSWMETGGKALKIPIERAYFLHPDIGLIAKTFKKGGIRALKEVRIEVGVPVIPQLCQRVPTAAEIMEKMVQVAAEPKYDGTRVQLHIDREQRLDDGGQMGMGIEGFEKPKFFVKTFTRNLEENTLMFPDLLEAANKQINATSVILDGEAVGFNPRTGQILPFQETVQRKRKHGISEKASEIPLRLYNFDLLYLNGENLTELPLSTRRKKLLEIIRPVGDKLAEVGISSLSVAEQTPIGSAKELDAALDTAHKEGLEGIVLKNPNSPYEPGSRGYNWVKFKRMDGESETGRLTDTIDAVVLGYNYGTGKRTDFGIGAFLVGVYDEENDRFVTIAKIGTGLTDEQWREMKRRCDEIRTKEKPTGVVVNKMLEPDVWTEPKMVVVIRADEITRSPVHSAGYALRFPRLLSWREDKMAEQATSLKEYHDLYRSQFKKAK